MRNKNAHDVEYPAMQETAPGSLTAETFSNPWAGHTVEDLDAWCMDAVKSTERNEPGPIFILDKEGFAGQTVILADRHVRFEEGDEADYQGNENLSVLTDEWDKTGSDCPGRVQRRCGR
ncbi:Hypothetical predicted protein [Lecanosticta acicola]|uniref:Uncharacterized protein n=1 Tax=Lecanosticta acicola TaxID=111012 RepID=A0AAI8YSY4_9PEZI|nr:Hypothetical predicted protein [Lecanosticta acicola]